MKLKFFPFFFDNFKKLLLLIVNSFPTITEIVMELKVESLQNI